MSSAFIVRIKWDNSGKQQEESTVLRKMVASYYCELSFVLGTVKEIKKHLLIKGKLSIYHVFI